MSVGGSKAKAAPEPATPPPPPTPSTKAEAAVGTINPDRATSALTSLVNTGPGGLARKGKTARRSLLGGA